MLGCQVKGRPEMSAKYGIPTEKIEKEVKIHHGAGSFLQAGL
jgi:hypothetical protein